MNGALNFLLLPCTMDGWMGKWMYGWVDGGMPHARDHPVPDVEKPPGIFSATPDVIDEIVIMISFDIL